MTLLKAPSDVPHSDIDGTRYETRRDGTVDVRDPDHIRALRRHGYTDPVAAAPATAIPQAAVAATPPAYFTGPYHNVLATLRAGGIEVADDAADSVVLRLVNEAIGRDAAHLEDERMDEVRRMASAGEPLIDVTRDRETVDHDGRGQDPLASPTPKRPNFNGMKQPDVVGWLRENGVTTPDETPYAQAVQIAKDRWAEMNPGEGG